MRSGKAAARVSGAANLLFAIAGGVIVADRAGFLMASGTRRFFWMSRPDSGENSDSNFTHVQHNVQHNVILNFPVNGDFMVKTSHRKAICRRLQAL